MARKKTAAEPEVQTGAVAVAEPEAKVEEPKGPVYPPHIAESREALKFPVPVDQEFYEAPDGYIIVAEAGKNHVWYRQGNNGEGQWINPMR